MMLFLGRRRDMKKQYIFLIILGVLITNNIISCGVTLNPVKRKPLIINSVKQELPYYSKKILVYFEEVIPNKPLNETVWDNINGPFWNIEESKQIGFTQNYEIKQVTLPEISTVAISDIDTRIIIPFGNIFTKVFESALNKSFSEYFICFNNECYSKIIKQEFLDFILRIKLENFHVWEKPLNHINFTTKISSKFIKSDTEKKEVVEYVCIKEILKYKIGGVISTSSHFIGEMNTISNNFAEEISVDIIKNGIK